MSCTLLRNSWFDHAQILGLKICLQLLTGYTLNKIISGNKNVSSILKSPASKHAATFFSRSWITAIGKPRNSAGLCVGNSRGKSLLKISSHFLMAHITSSWKTKFNIDYLIVIVEAWSQTAGNKVSWYHAYMHWHTQLLAEISWNIWNMETYETLAWNIRLISAGFRCFLNSFSVYRKNFIRFSLKYTCAVFKNFQRTKFYSFQNLSPGLILKISKISASIFV